MLTRLRKANLTAKARKCDLSTNLAHQVGGGVVRPEKSKLLAIQALEVPQMNAYLPGYYRRFISPLPPL